MPAVIGIYKAPHSWAFVQGASAIEVATDLDLFIKSSELYNLFLSSVLHIFLTRYAIWEFLSAAENSSSTN